MLQRFRQAWPVPQLAAGFWWAAGAGHRPPAAGVV